MTTTKEWPDAVIKQIIDSIAYTAPTRTLSTLLPFDSIKFGKDEKMILGDRIVGGNTATHTILKNQGLAGALKDIIFLDAKRVGWASCCPPHLGALKKSKPT